MATESTDFDTGPLSPHDVTNQPGRTGLVSPVLNRSLCLASQGNSIGATSCGTGNDEQLALGFERLVLSGKCITVTRPALNLRELPATLLPCDGSNPNQRFGYRAGAFFWGQDPNRCLDASEILSSGGKLMASLCNNGGNQIFSMNSLKATSQPTLPMGPPSLYTPMGNGFLGSDAGATASLDYNRTIFIFNDTYVNQQGGNSRGQINGFVHNTVGIMECDDIIHTIGCRIRYFFGGSQDYTKPIFADPNQNFYFWPNTGTLYNGELFILNERVVSTNTGLGFDLVGAMIGQITNPQDSPDLWDIHQNEVTHDGAYNLVYQIWQRQTVAGTWQPEAGDANYAYMYFTRNGLGLARLPFDQLSNPNAYLLSGTSSWQYLSTKNVWNSWPAGSSARPVDAAASVAPNGMSLGNVNFEPSTNTYYFIGASSNFETRGTFYATAPTASGPWSGEKLLYMPPQYDQASSNYIPNTRCYASFSHPELAPVGQIAFTYQCGGDSSNPLVNRQNLVILPIPWK